MADIKPRIQKATEIFVRVEAEEPIKVKPIGIQRFCATISKDEAMAFAEMIERSKYAQLCWETNSLGNLTLWVAPLR